MCFTMEWNLHGDVQSGTWLRYLRKDLALFEILTSAGFVDCVKRVDKTHYRDIGSYAQSCA